MILAKHGVVLHDQEAVVALLRDGHELEARKSAAHLNRDKAAIQLVRMREKLPLMKRIL